MMSCTRSPTQGKLSWDCFEGWEMCPLQLLQIQKTRVCMCARFYLKYHCPAICRWNQVASKCHSHSKMLLQYHNMYSCQAILLHLDLVGNHSKTTTLSYCILLITKSRNAQLATLNFVILLVQCSLVLYYSTKRSISSPNHTKPSKLHLSRIDITIVSFSALNLGILISSHR